MLAVDFFTKYFKHYLLGRHFILRTDHGSLGWLHRFKEPEGQVQRWLQQLSQFDFEIHVVHRPRLKHGNADAMSRLVRGDLVICRQCEMPWPDISEVPRGNYFLENSEMQINLYVLENSEDESSDGGNTGDKTPETQLPQCLLFDMSSAEDFTHSAKRSLSDRYRLEGMQQCCSLH